MFTIKILGQVHGGKNNMIITKSGKHIPTPTFEKWRNRAVYQVQQQKFKKITKPCSASFHYIAGDKRKRDIPAILDAVFHVLERAGVVEDDCLIENLSEFKKSYDKENPQIIITIEVKA